MYAEHIYQKDKSHQNTENSTIRTNIPIKKRAKCLNWRLSKWDKQIASKQMKRFPHCMSSRKCKLKNNEIALNTHQNDQILTVWSNRNSFIAGGNAKYSHLEKNVLSILLIYNPPIMLLGIYPNKLKTYVHTKSCTPLSIAAFFMNVKNWKQSRCSSVIEWTNHRTMDYNGLLRYEKKWTIKPQKRMKET